MSIHLKIPEYECGNCKTPFMAYSKGLECPKCGQPEESQGESYNFIDDQVWAMLYHKKKYKRFTPGAWYTGCYCDQVQQHIFKTFDFVYKNPESSLENQSKGVIMYDGDNNEFTNDKYILDLFLAIDKKLKEKEDRRLINRIKNTFKLYVEQR